MDKRTRVLNALQGKSVDVVPCGFWMHFQGGPVGEESVQAHLSYYRDTDLDFIKIMSDGALFDFSPYKIDKASDWAKIKPAGRDSAFIQDSLWRAKRIKEESKGECCVFYNMFAPFSLIRFFAGDARVMAHVREDEKAVMSALQAVAEDSALLAQLLITEAGMDGIYDSVQGGEVLRFTSDEYRRIVSPSDLMILEAANEVSDLNIFHMCGYDGGPNHLEVWRDYPASIVNWATYIENMSLAQGRAFLGEKCKCILGGFDNRKVGVLYRGDKQSVQAEARRLVREAGVRGTMIGADCTIPNDIDLDRIRWVIEAVREESAS